MQLNMVAENWLLKRNLSKEVLAEFNIHSSEDRIVIPVSDEDGIFIFNKYRRNPLSEVGSKYTYDKGGKVSLYAWHKAKNHPSILITEGELDTLVAWSHNIPAVTSTGGAGSFQERWADLFKDKEVIVCYDNDMAGGEGMAKVLNYIPHARILFLPDRAGVKDISDYVASGGDIHELLRTSKRFASLADVYGDRTERLALWKSTHFHDAYIREHTKVVVKREKKVLSGDEVTNAKAYPVENLLTFTSNKRCCPFHKEKTPSFVLYPETNSCYCFGCGKAFDSIEIYRKLHDCTFRKAVEELNK